MNRPMHLRDRKLKTMLVGLQLCMQTMGSGGSEGTDGTTFHQYTGNHQRTELILLSHI